MILSRRVLLRKRNVSDKICRENQNTHFVFSEVLMNVVPFMRCGGKNGAGGLATDNIIRRMRIACWITKATDRHSEYVILIAFAWQHWLCERASV
jgi:hypothetical protein